MLWSPRHRTFYCRVRQQDSRNPEHNGSTILRYHADLPIAATRNTSLSGCGTVKLREDLNSIASLTAIKGVGNRLTVTCIGENKSSFVLRFFCPDSRLHAMPKHVQVGDIMRAACPKQAFSDAPSPWLPRTFSPVWWSAIFVGRHHGFTFGCEYQDSRTSDITFWGGFVRDCSLLLLLLLCSSLPTSSPLLQHHQLHCALHTRRTLLLAENPTWMFSSLLSNQKEVVAEQSMPVPA